MSDDSIVDDVGALLVGGVLLVFGALFIGGIVRAISNYEPEPAPRLREIVTTERVGDVIVERHYLPAGR